jgi:hypothetical protein
MYFDRLLEQTRVLTQVLGGSICCYFATLSRGF